jgi:hypothetical protein
VSSTGAGQPFNLASPDHLYGETDETQGFIRMGVALYSRCDEHPRHELVSTEGRGGASQDFHSTQQAMSMRQWPQGKTLLSVEENGVNHVPESKAAAGTTRETNPSTSVRLLWPET